MNINGYVPFLINTLDFIVRRINMLTKSTFIRSTLLDVGAGEDEHLRSVADTPRVSVGRPPRL